MGRTKQLQFQIGDIIQGKTKLNRGIYLVVDKKAQMEWSRASYSYTIIGLDIEGTFGIYSDTNNKHWKVLS